MMDHSGGIGSDIPSVSPTVVNGERHTVPQATPELMNLSPLSNVASQDRRVPSVEPHVSVMDQVRQLEWLHSRKLQLQAQLEACKPELSPKIDGMEKTQLLELYEKLKDEYAEKTAVHDSRECLLRGEQLNQLILNLNDSPEAEDQQKFTELSGLMDTVSTLSTQVATEHQENVQLKADLEKVKKKNFELLKRTRQLYTELDKKKQARQEDLETLTTDTKGKRLHERLQTQLQWNTIQNNTLQGLILGSGINWAQDTQLQTLIVDAGKTPHI